MIFLSSNCHYDPPSPLYFTPITGAKIIRQIQWTARDSVVYDQITSWPCDGGVIWTKVSEQQTPSICCKQNTAISAGYFLHQVSLPVGSTQAPPIIWNNKSISSKVWMCLMQKIFGCVPHVWKGNSQKYPVLILGTMSRVCMWKRLKRLEMKCKITHTVQNSIK